jgi:hypothetical protein
MKRLTVLIVCFLNVFVVMAGQGDIGWKWGVAETQSSPFFPLGTTILYHEDSQVHITIADGGYGYCFIVRGSEKGNMDSGELAVVFTNKGGYAFAAVSNATYQIWKLQIINGRIEKCDTTFLPQLTGKNDLPDYAAMDGSGIIIGSLDIPLSAQTTKIIQPLRKESYQSRPWPSAAYSILGRKFVGRFIPGINVAPGKKILNINK